MKTHGDPGWETLPSYHHTAVPRILSFLSKHKLSITFFLVGLDADQPANISLFRQIADAGHEIGNHSYHHEPWLHKYSASQIDHEITKAGHAIERATGKRPIGFRGPGFSVSTEVLETLARHGYRYDCSTFPTYLGPLARAYYFATSTLPKEERDTRAQLFGKWNEGTRPLHFYRWHLTTEYLLEIPVTTMPLLKTPIHLSYLVYLSTVSPSLANAYFTTAVQCCRATGVGMSLLLHPLDFLGPSDAPELAFFPGMSLPLEKKLAVAEQAIKALRRRFEPRCMQEHALAALSSRTLRTMKPRFS
jgi:peptidoglycan/xylan/chitin deacetylase (PgdA/CDA1 family)